MNACSASPDPREAADHEPRVVPYHTGKVQIGIAYTPKPALLTADQERMQAALLEPRTALPQTPLQRLFGRIWSWL
jgi:hypothetical protein